MSIDPSVAVHGNLVGSCVDAYGRNSILAIDWRGVGFALGNQVPHSQRSTLVGAKKAARLELFLPAGDWTLTFLRHEWSGEVLVCDSNQYRLFDLHTPQGANTFDVEVFSGGFQTPVIVETTGVKCAASKDIQVWLLSVRQLQVTYYPERGTRVSETCRLVGGRHGQFLVLRNDIGIPETLAATGEWEPTEVELYRRLVRPGDHVVDVGANFGHHTVVLSRLVGEAGKVVAFEPQMQMFNLLNANLVINRCRNVLPFRVALGQSTDRLNMFPVSFDDFLMFGALGIDAKKEAIVPGEQVHVVRLDDFLPQLELPDRPVSFLKIDVQAYELFVLRGARSLIKLDSPSISFEVSPWWMRRAGYEWTEIFDLLGGLGYSFFDAALRPLSLPVWDGISQGEWQCVAIHSSRSF